MCHKRPLGHDYRENLSARSIIDGAFVIYIKTSLRQRAAPRQHPPADGIGTLIHYPIPPHLQQPYSTAGWGLRAFPLAERMADQVLSLPMGPHLQANQVEAVIAATAKDMAVA